MLLDKLRDFLHQRVKSRALFIDHRRAAHQCHERAISVFDAHGRRAFATLDHHLDLTVFLFLRLQDAPQRSHAVDLFGSRLVDGGIVLGGKKYRAIRRERLFQRLD